MDSTLVRSNGAHVGVALIDLFMKVRNISYVKTRTRNVNILNSLLTNGVMIFHCRSQYVAVEQYSDRGYTFNSF